ncbi:hypothetical protein Pta02_54480 [Planobispora takensis]|uniref:Uncharacterized protein n=1 Tax=Planobispora takensis TaxID=1367882 RepID=A0A8J3T1Z7_9ACTN|nr:hypothetical protein Pta02_54480 [Planobispora takensis]
MRGRLLRAEGELPLDHAEHVDGDPGVEADPALDRGEHVALQEVTDRGDEPGRRRDVVGTVAGTVAGTGARWILRHKELLIR